MRAVNEKLRPLDRNPFYRHHLPAQFRCQYGSQRKSFILSFCARSSGPNRDNKGAPHPLKPTNQPPKENTLLKAAGWNGMLGY